MAVKKHSDNAPEFQIRSWRDFPAMNTSVGNMLHNKTGSWRFIKPLYEDKIPACQNACPAGNDIEGWIRLIQKGDIEAAYWHLKREEPFPAILGRVCFRFCQQVCSRAPFDSCVNIRELERYVGESAPADPTHPDLGPEKGKRLAVVGSGPAGMSAAYFGRLLGFSVVIFEARSEPGGLLRVGIPGYRLPRRIVAAEFETLRRMGIRVHCATTIGTQIAFSELRSEFDYIFLATGNHVGLKMRISGEDKCPRILSGLALLEQVAMGKKPDLGRQVVVVGGGNTAIDAARTAVRLGCAATVLYRRTEEQMPAYGQEVSDAREEGVRFRFLTAPERIDLNPDGSIRSLICSEMMLGTIDDSGRPCALRKPDSRLEICADTVLTAIGEAPSFDYLAGAVSIDKTVLAVNSGLQVLLEDHGGTCIFAGGDIIDTPHTVVHAVATGKRAAIAMDCDSTGRAWHKALDDITIGSGPALSFSRYMDLKPVTPTRRNWRKVVGQQRIVFDYFKRTPPAHREIQPPSARVTSFRPYSSTYADKTARQEAARCLHCGRCTECDNCLVFCPDLSVLKPDDAEFGYRVDYDYCKGCGVCFTECPRDAITMVDEDNVLEPEES